MEREIFVFIGAPGSGKGTRIKYLKKIGYKTLSMSGLLREKGFDVTTGRLIADDDVIKVVIEAINLTEESLVLDGFPRTLPQADALFKNNIKIDKVFYIEASQELILERCLDRLTCPVCGSSYTKGNFKPPQSEGICDVCKCNLIKRVDDTRELIVKRLNDFTEKTQPILKVFKDAGIPVITLDANLPPSEILKYI